EGAGPLMAAIRRVEEPGGPEIGRGHPDREREVGMREFDPAGALAPGLLLAPVRRDPMQGLAGGDERAEGGRVLDRPGEPAIFAPRQEMLLRAVVVDVVPLGAIVLVIAGREADEDLVAPRPDPVVSRPAAEPARPVVDLDVADDAGGTGRVGHWHGGISRIV